MGFFQAVRAVLAKSTPGERKTDEELDHAIRQIVSKAVASDEVMDIFAAAGLKKPDISILSDEFLAEVQGMPQQNLAVELLRKLLNGEIKIRQGTWSSPARSPKCWSSYPQVPEPSHRNGPGHRGIDRAGERYARSQCTRRGAEADRRRMAFYDALEVNDSAVKVLGEPTLATIARELVATVRKNVTIDWTVRENGVRNFGSSSNASSASTGIRRISKRKRR